VAEPVQRLIGGFGIAYVVLTIAPALFLPPPPPGGAALAEVSRYYTEHREALLVAGWVGLLAFPIGFAYLAGLTVILRGRDSTSTWLAVVALLSISVTLSVAAVQGILALATPYVAGSAAQADVKLLADVTQLGFSATFPLQISYFAAIGFLGLRTRAIPQWLSYGAFVVVVAAVGASLGIIVASGPLAAGGPVTLVALVAGLLWWLVAGVRLLVRPSTAVA
jgi:hypothetical protein